MWAETKHGSWYRVRLHEALVGWVNEEDVEPGPAELEKPSATVTDISMSSFERGVRLRISMSGPVPYRVREQIGRPSQLKLDLFGAQLACYGVRWRAVEPFVSAVVPEQTMTSWAQITVNLQTDQIAGYSVCYPDTRTLLLDIRRPCVSAGIQGKVIAIDPGHGGKDKGAIAPAGMQEKDANLAIALQLRAMLQAHGATVIMTRETDVSVAPADATLRAELTSRVLATKGVWPDLFLSIHNNHIGTGDPLTAYGTETYYWAAMSQRAAQIIHQHLCAQLGTHDRFVSWRPFLVLRETDCPRVLVECVYMSHPDESALLSNPTFITQAAEGLLHGLVAYFTVTAPGDAIDYAVQRGGSVSH